MASGSTANLAAFMIKVDQGSYIRDMAQAIDQRRVVCVALAVQDELQLSYPQARLRGLSFSGDFAEAYTANVRPTPLDPHSLQRLLNNP